MKRIKHLKSDNKYESGIYRLAYEKYMEFYLSGNVDMLKNFKEIVFKYELDISEQDLLWWKSYKYEKWVEFKEKQK